MKFQDYEWVVEVRAFCWHFCKHKLQLFQIQDMKPSWDYRIHSQLHVTKERLQSAVKERILLRIKILHVYASTANSLMRGFFSSLSVLLFDIRFKSRVFDMDFVQNNRKTSIYVIDPNVKSDLLYIFTKLQASFKRNKLRHSHKVFTKKFTTLCFVTACPSRNI